MAERYPLDQAFTTNQLSEQNDLVSLHYSDFRLYDSVRVSIYQSLYLRAIRHVRGVIELNCGALRICYYYNNIFYRSYWIGAVYAIHVLLLVICII